MSDERNTMAGRLVLAVMMVVLAVSAAPAGDYEIVWSTIDGGGGLSEGGGYSVRGTIGQPDAGYLGRVNYELLGGYWVGGALCFVEFDDFARFLDYWLETGVGIPGDLDGSEEVDFDDMKELASYWLELCPYGWPLK